MPQVLLSAALVGLLVIGHPHADAQDPRATAPAFDAVSIKRNTSPVGSGGGIRILPDGTLMATNVPISSLIGGAEPVPGIFPGNIVGLPGWARSDNYDVIARPPAGTPRDQLGPMWRTFFATRMKLVAHVEQREATTFALVLARSDGRLGPALEKSTLDCTPRTPPAPSLPPTQGPPDFANRCGMVGTGTSIISGGMTMDMLARNLSGRAGGPVTNRTGLEGYYAFTLKFSPPGGAPPGANPDDAPDFFTAIQEQLGLKLQAEKGTVPYFVIDHIERPTDN
jgi:uncharacterized protein (TIGR03435 family)